MPSLDRLRSVVKITDDNKLGEQLQKLFLQMSYGNFEDAKELSSKSDFRFHEVDTKVLIEGVSKLKNIPCMFLIF